MRTRPTLTLVALLVAALALVSCDGDDTPDRSRLAASVDFVEPVAGQQVQVPFAWRAQVTNVTIEPAGASTDGGGHLHIVIDEPCVRAGEVVPDDDAHVHVGDGATDGRLDVPLTPGEHTLCLQVADGQHVALDLTDEITVTVD